jgi:hypothetical protein
MESVEPLCVALVAAIIWLALMNWLTKPRGR